jgi:hypothetical protein
VPQCAPVSGCNVLCTVLCYCKTDLKRTTGWVGTGLPGLRVGASGGLFWAVVNTVVHLRVL